MRKRRFAAIGLFRLGSITACALLLASITLFNPGACGTGLRVQAATVNLPSIPRGESPAQEQRQSAGCISCHGQTDSPTMHTSSAVVIGCADCHGGDPSVFKAGAPGSRDYLDAERKAHVQPLFPEDADRGGHPVRVYARWLKESQAFVRFVNPGDLRIARQTCGSSGCHADILTDVRHSMMATGAMLWEAALYNNGAFPYKNARFGESYSPDGKPQMIFTFPPPTKQQTRDKGILPYLEPLDRWEVSQPGNVLRVFERGGGAKSGLGNPDGEDEPGSPDLKLSDRGFGTQLRTDPVFLGLQKTRLLGPMLYIPGTNDQPGDYRASGCSGCHVIYANDRSPVHSAQYAVYGHNGTTATIDPTIPKNESAHPIQHVFALTIPSSQCMVCHVHPGTNMETTYFGYTWWDNEVDGDLMYPKKQRNPTPEQYHQAELRDPEGSTAKGLWANVDFLRKTGSAAFNSKLKDTQFADFHSHGWIFRAVYWRDRQGHLLDKQGKRIPSNDPHKFSLAVHLKDIHLKDGMHCIDCHFEQDVHGNGKLYGETRNAVEIQCEDCHGTIEHRATLIASGPASPGGEAANLARLRTPWGKRLFYWKNGQLYQRSNVEKGTTWRIVQVLDSITPNNPDYNWRSRLAKTMQTDGKTWGRIVNSSLLAHSDSSMTCYTCHSSWTTSCFGCHLSMKANQRMPMEHNEGLMTRNWTSYDFNVLRTDVYMLGIDGTVTGHRVAPVRSACAIVVSSQNANRDWLYREQQTISAPGFSGEAFSTYVPHTVSGRRTTKECTACHVSANEDNNAWMAQILIQGTNFLNFMGRFAYVGIGKGGFEAIPISEQQQPPAIYGSDLDQIAYPSYFAKFVKHGRKLTTGYRHRGNVEDLQLRGEYLYAAMGHDGFRIFDVANVDVKDVSQRIITAPVSPLGQKFYLKTKDAAAIASPSTLALDPLRTQLPVNEEQGIAPLYAFLYVADRQEGLIVVGDPKTGVGTLLDGNPENNFLKRAVTFNPRGRLDGAHRITIAGNYAYILCNRGLEVVDLKDPLHPRITAEIGTSVLHNPTGIAVQFRYMFVTDADGLKVFDVTHLSRPVPVVGADVPLNDARNVYVSRTYAYVSDGRHGIAIVDVTRPPHPHLLQIFNANGELNDVNDLKIGMVSSEQFAFVANGKSGFSIVQLFGPKEQPDFFGFSPRPVPRLIAVRSTPGPALAVSKGIDRDRAVDESGNQLAVFGRRGAHPFTLKELHRMYLRNGKLYAVTNRPPGAPLSLYPEKPKRQAAAMPESPPDRTK